MYDFKLVLNFFKVELRLIKDMNPIDLKDKETMKDVLYSMVIRCLIYAMAHIIFNIIFVVG